MSNKWANENERIECRLTNENVLYRDKETVDKETEKLYGKNRSCFTILWDTKSNNKKRDQGKSYIHEEPPLSIYWWYGVAKNKEELMQWKLEIGS